MRCLPFSLRRSSYGTLPVIVLCLAAAPGGALRAADPGKEEPSAAERFLRIRPRYYRWHVDPGQEWTEKNTSYSHLDWDVPLSQAALVLVDVWDRHYIKEPEVRAERIIQEKIRPLLAACRRAGLQIIHAPSPAQAKTCAAWVGRERQASPGAAAARPAEPPWPPADFRAKRGPYAKYARPDEPMAKVRAKRLEGLSIHPDVRPERNDVVVATGEELHQYCREKGILFLFYAGFNTNACVLMRDYGTLEMGKRGYEIIILRDCTTGMESFETSDQLWQTRGAILLLEMFGSYSLTLDELMAGLPDGRGDGR